MPELPEVETMRRGILPVVGRRIARAERPPCPRRPIAIRPRIDLFQKRVAGKTIVAVKHGKRVVIWLAATVEPSPSGRGQGEGAAAQRRTVPEPKP